MRFERLKFDNCKCPFLARVSTLQQQTLEGGGRHSKQPQSSEIIVFVISAQAMLRTFSYTSAPVGTSQVEGRQIKVCLKCVGFYGLDELAQGARKVMAKGLVNE